ncbi:MAG TPA: methionyl-tRNA formyltransferase [Chitinophagaceae bacterium]|nr:MAG: methionyl-tRNA formyltransferase [Bacteroidetes bacterium OLB11]HMN33613.1 methionyl-tRNA formyltransferase [Chitinophagaceae bacterium]
MKIVYFGTPEFAVASLKALLNHPFEMVAVVTSPDRPAGRGMMTQMSAVKAFAIEHQLKILQPANLKDISFLDELRALNADLFIVVAFRMLPALVWDMPPLGTINLHASLLPQYRGAAPINWAIINGESQTGVTTFKLQHQIDTGNILLQKTIDILSTDNAGTLHNKLMIEGAQLLVETVSQLEAKTIVEKTQIHLDNLKLAPKIFTTTCEINWSQSAKQIHQLVNGLSPYPAAFTFLNKKKLKILKTSYQIETHQLMVGNILSDNKIYLKFACNDGFVFVEELQLEGKKRMKVDEFLRGNKINPSA